MKEDSKILLLAGSFEARCVAEALIARAMSYDAWLSETPRGPAPLPRTPLLRRFEDTAAFQRAVAQGGYTAVLDAGHVFDHSVTQQAFTAATALGLPYLRLARPAWQITGQAKWQSAVNVEQANAMIPAGARVFCATGWDSLPDFSDFIGETLMLRQTRRHTRTPPYPFVELVFGDPPFTVDAEIDLFKALRIDVLVCRNIGGVASRTKLDAAEVLNLDVILIDRPVVAVDLPMVADTDAALDWLATL